MPLLYPQRPFDESSTDSNDFPQPLVRSENTRVMTPQELGVAVP